jgi:hypothetical protein
MQSVPALLILPSGPEAAATTWTTQIDPCSFALSVNVEIGLRVKPEPHGAA